MELKNLLERVETSTNVQFSKTLENVEKKIADHLETLTTLITSSHNLLVTGIDNVETITQSQLLDAKYLRQPPNQYSFQDFPMCRFAKFGENEYSFFKFFAIELLKLKDDEAMEDYLSCEQHHSCDLPNTIYKKFGVLPGELAAQVLHPKKEEENQKDYVIVVTCKQHHYLIANMSFVTPKFSGKFLKRVDDQEVEMYLYILKNGM